MPVWDTSKGLIDSAHEITQIDVIPKAIPHMYMTARGNVIEHLVGANANREYIEIRYIPKVVQNAFISIEDERFYQHDGIDVREYSAHLFRYQGRGI